MSENMIELISTSNSLKYYDPNYVSKTRIRDGESEICFRNLELTVLIKHLNENRDKKIQMYIPVSGVMMNVTISMYQLEKLKNANGSNFTFEHVAIYSDKIVIFDNQ